MQTLLPLIREFPIPIRRENGELLSKGELAFLLTKLKNEEDGPLVIKAGKPGDQDLPPLSCTIAAVGYRAWATWKTLEGALDIEEDALIALIQKASPVITELLTAKLEGRE